MQGNHAVECSHHASVPASAARPCRGVAGPRYAGKNQLGRVWPWAVARAWAHLPTLGLWSTRRPAGRRRRCCRRNSLSGVVMELLDLTTAMQSILMHHGRGYTLWLGFTTDQSKLPALDEKWAMEFGTHEPAWRRHDRKGKGIPNAVAIAGKVFSQPSRAEVVLMSTEDARKIAHDSPHRAFLRQQWRDDLPRFSHFEIVHQPTEATGKLVWTWRIRKIELSQIEKRLIALCNIRDLDSLHRETFSMVRNFPMFNGVRSQTRRLLRHVRRKCESCKMKYPGPDPDNLPMMLSFKRIKSGFGVEDALTSAAGALPIAQRFMP